MANEEQLQILLRGSKVWNERRIKKPNEEVLLSKANLRGANLSKSDLRGANLIEANLSKANLSGAYGHL